MRGFYHSQDSRFMTSGIVLDVAGVGTAASGIAQAAGSVAAAGIQAGAISDAASKQAASAKYAQDLIQGRYDTTRTDFNPYREVGQIGIDSIKNNLAGFATTDSSYTGLLQQNLPGIPGRMTQADLESTPGYAFTRDQGLKATQNSAAARGLGVSGAALKGAATFATGLSDQTYNNRFAQQQQLFGNQQQVFGDVQTLYGNEQTSKANAWNRLAGLVNTGLSASGQQATIGANAASQTAGIAQNAGNAQAAAGIATGNAIGGGINGITNAFQQNDAYNRLFGDGGSSSIYSGNGGFNSSGSSAPTWSSGGGSSAFD